MHAQLPGRRWIPKKCKLYYIRFDGTGVCVESCPNATNWSALWACTDDDSDFTTQEGYDCGGDPTVCLAKADLSATGKGGGSFEGNGKGTCMFQVESIECKSRTSLRPTVPIISQCWWPELNKEVRAASKRALTVIFFFFFFFFRKVSVPAIWIPSCCRISLSMTWRTIRSIS